MHFDFIFDLSSTSVKNENLAKELKKTQIEL